jgi:hypothetical protein
METKIINGKTYTSNGKYLPYYRFEDDYVYILPNTTRQAMKNYVGVKEHKLNKETFYKRDVANIRLIVVDNKKHRLEVSHYVTKLPAGQHLVFPTFLMEGLTGTTMYDHADLDETNDTDENLRPATAAQNSYNKPIYKNNTLGYKGLVRSGRRFMARIMHHYKFIFGNTYNTKIVAGLAYNELAKEHFKEFAHINDISTEDIIKAYEDKPEDIRKDLKMLDADFGTDWSSIITKK